ncbi:MAG: hypothetical protein U5K30_09450 [Acidimicrobiales bacterium]|nr:hypothetical protein [Acidimicrobiales bacterium]
MYPKDTAQRRRPVRAAVGDTGFSRVLLAVLVPVLLAAVTACSSAPAEGTERGADGTTTTRVDPVPPPVRGALRAQVDGVGPSASPDGLPDLHEPPAHVLLVGDSVLVQVTDDLARQLSSTLYVDAADCRRIDMDVSGSCGGVPAGATVPGGIEAIEDNIEDLARNGISPDAAVIVLANNSNLRAEELDAAMDALSGVPRVWWVTTRIEGFGRQDLNNTLLADLAERNPRAGVIDWYEHSRGEDWFGDHVHPNPAGEVALSWLITRQLRCDCPP